VSLRCETVPHRIVFRPYVAVSAATSPFPATAAAAQLHGLPEQPSFFGAPEIIGGSQAEPASWVSVRFTGRTLVMLLRADCRLV
jgi:hypothetical protein